LTCILKKGLIKRTDAWYERGSQRHVSKREKEKKNETAIEALVDCLPYSWLITQKKSGLGNQGHRMRRGGRKRGKRGKKDQKVRCSELRETWGTSRRSDAPKPTKEPAQHQKPEGIPKKEG